MKLHGNARTCPKSRRLLVERVLVERWSVTAAAAAAGVSERTVWRWLKRFREEGELGLLDRSSRPYRSPTRLSQTRVEAIEKLRRLRMTAAQIAEILEIPLSTVSAWLRRVGLGKRSRLEPPEPPNRYERRRPGELVHLDVKKLGRIQVPGHRVTGNRRVRARRHHYSKTRSRGTAGWEFVHVCVDDATRLAYAEVLPDERGATAAGFLRRALAWFDGYGVKVERVISDNGSCYRSAAHAAACSELGVRRHIFTRPYRPRTNGKAERFIQTLTNKWAYGAIYGSSAERTAALPGWLNHYNFTRPHGSLKKKPPSSRLTNLPGNYT
jgi:transposase InsO family protein